MAKAKEVIAAEKDIASCALNIAGFNRSTIADKKRLHWEDGQLTYLISRSLDILALAESAKSAILETKAPNVVAYLAPKPKTAAWCRFGGNTMRDDAIKIIDDAVADIIATKDHFYDLNGQSAREFSKALAPAFATIQFYTGTVPTLGYDLAAKKIRAKEITRLHKIRWSKKEKASREALIKQMFGDLSTEIRNKIKSNESEKVA